MKRQLLLSMLLSLLCAGWGSVAFATNHEIGSTITVDSKTYYVASTNLITNGSFENGFTGWTKASDFSTTISTDFELREDDPEDGSSYLVGTSTSDNGSVAGASGTSSLGTAWEIKAGKTYYFCYWIKNLNSATETTYLKTSLTNTKGDETKVLGYPETVSADWQQVEYLFTNGSEGSDDCYSYIQVKFRWLNKQWGFDDFQLYEVQEEAITLPTDDDYDYQEGDTAIVNGITWTVKSENLFNNGGFNNGVDGWTAGGYEKAANLDNFTVYAYGGYNDGAYLVTNSAGASNEATPSQAIKVDTSKTYLFVGYTNGTEPDHRYSALFEMDDEGTAETNHIEDGTTSYSNEVVRLNWGDGTEWCQTKDVFSPATGYVGMRMGWSNGSYDGFQIYEVEAVALTEEEEPSSENPMDMTNFITNYDASQVSNIGWTGSGNITRSSKQHWSGDTSRQYFEPNHWDASGIFEESIYQNITLPYNGVYRLTAAGRASDGTTTTLFAGDMEYTFPTDGDTGGTIATDGTTCEVGTAGKSFAHDNAGYGWNWGSVEVVATAGMLKIGAKFDETLSSESHKWASITDFKLEYLGNDLTAIKEALATSIDEAEEIDVTTNVGTTAFKRPQEAADALTVAIEAAETALEDENADATSLTAATKALQAAVHNFDNAELNKPAEGETYSIILSQDGGTYDGGAVTAVYSSSNSSNGYYRFYFYHGEGENKVADWNRNFASQNFTFTPDDSKLNGYTISFADEDNNTHYICLGTVYNGGDNKQTRATTTESSAFVFQVVVTSTDGIWKLYNSDKGQNTGNGSNDGGLYTSDTGAYSDLQLVSNAIPVNITDAGWTTLVLPYDASLPSGSDLTAYTVEGKSETQENAVTLTEVENGELKAKTPYLINGKNVAEYAINGTSTVFDLSTEAKDDYLVGTWEYISSVPTGNYVLQYQPEVSGTAFYIVDSSESPITLAANRCYLSGSSISTANAPYLSLSMGDDISTAIEAVAEETAETAGGAIYDLSGRRVSKAQKGIYIKDGKKVIIK